MKFVTTILAFIILAASFNIYDHFGEWSWSEFLAGFACGLPVLTCHLLNRKVGLTLFVISFSTLLFVAVGLVQVLEVKQLFFTGMSIGVIMGWIPALLLVRAKAVQFLVQSAKMDGYTGLAQRIESRFN